LDRWGIEPLLHGIEVVAEGRVGAGLSDIIDVDLAWGREGWREIGREGREGREGGRGVRYIDLNRHC